VNWIDKLEKTLAEIDGEIRFEEVRGHISVDVATTCHKKLREVVATLGAADTSIRAREKEMDDEIEFWKKRSTPDNKGGSCEGCAAAHGTMPNWESWRCVTCDRGKKRLYGDNYSAIPWGGVPNSGDLYSQLGGTCKIACPARHGCRSKPDGEECKKVQYDLAFLRGKHQ